MLSGGFLQFKITKAFDIIKLHVLNGAYLEFSKKLGIFRVSRDWMLSRIILHYFGSQLIVG